MPDYRLRFLNAAGEPIAATDFHARDDDQARKLAADAVGAAAADLLRGSDLIAEFGRRRKQRTG